MEQTDIRMIDILPDQRTFVRKALRCNDATTDNNLLFPDTKRDVVVRHSNLINLLTLIMPNGSQECQYWTMTWKYYGRKTLSISYSYKSWDRGITKNNALYFEFSTQKIAIKLISMKFLHTNRIRQNLNLT